MVWTLVVLASLTLSGYFLYTNLEDYRDDTTIVTLYDQQATLDDNVFFPSVTICSSNQIRLAHSTQLLGTLHSTHLARLTFLKAIGIFTEQRKKSLLLRNFYTGNATMSLQDNLESKELVETALVQQEFCKYMKHTGAHRLYTQMKHNDETHR